MRQLVGAVQEGVEILVRACGLAGGQAPVVGQLADVLAHVAIAGAGVVDADLRARQAAQQLMDRLAGRLAEDVPERDVERGQAAHLGAAAGEADVGVEQRARVPVDRERVLAEQARRRRLVDVGDRGVRPEERLAEADQALVGVHVHPEQIRELVELNGLDRGDLHALRLPCPAFALRASIARPARLSGQCSGGAIATRAARAQRSSGRATRGANGRRLAGPIASRAATSRPSQPSSSSASAIMRRFG